ncbi:MULTISPECIES: hypothetical protein [Cyanophyceae]|uniref:hypothetical protein n=1 Tax=Cyanophyceae TaxID=3028117 RepID=UPI001689C97E|nr:hypothetical protein [Trichocoleus sp. FACHB-69]MBD1933336.1 hypothetical protein [Trichocoleus sp. FACHB-69]
MSPNAFVDNGFPSGIDFCIQFLSSPEFNVVTLRKLAPSASSKEKKQDLALRVAHALEQGQLTSNQVLLEYVKQPRMWLSLKQGQCEKTPNLKSPAQLLREFGKQGWYGPITDSTTPRKWYIHISKIPDYVRRGSGEASEVDKRYIRWPVIAEVRHNYVALHWEGFTFTEITEAHTDQAVQFPFWRDIHIPKLFDELTEHLQGYWVHPNLHRLVLHEMWNKYLEDFHYIWQHLLIRAEADGVALNARSSGVTEVNVKGLKALARKLAESASERLGLSDNCEQITHVENALLRTLIKEWGTKSYEFSLDRKPDSSEASSQDADNKAELENLFKAHCYFGLKQDSTQDSLQHLKCHSRYYGGSTGVLKFLLRELGLPG